MPHRAQPPFVPIGHPRMSQPTDSQDHRVGLHLLEALDSLDAVYGSAEFFAGVAAEAALGDYTLDRCLEGLQRDQGAIFLVENGELRPHAERGDANRLLRADLTVPGVVPPKAAFWAAAEAGHLLRDGAPPHNVLCCPIHVGDRRLGLVVVLSQPDHLFATGDVKLVTAVTSQAAIAISRTEHHRQVEIERRKLHELIEHHGDGIVELDQDGRTTLCNPIARELLGTPDALALLASLDANCSLEALARGGEEREVTVKVGDRTRVLGVTPRPVHGEDGALANVILTLRDLTRQRREDRLKRDFLSLISHKFRTPLTALICGIEILQSADAADREFFLSEIGQRTHDLRLLVDRLLYFAELLEGSWSTSGATDLRELAADIEQHVAPAPGAPPVELVWDLADDALVVPAPASRLRVALLNLVENAVKFGTADEPVVRIGSRRGADGAITLEVEDHGPGIPVSEREPLFGMFHQLDDDFTGAVQGAGIGLAMVQEIVSRLGGTLALRDATPRGCVFSLTFPAGAEA